MNAARALRMLSQPNPPSWLVDSLIAHYVAALRQPWPVRKLLPRRDMRELFGYLFA
jgi:hypothetical protein